jgi:hypothetical protein
MGKRVFAVMFLCGLALIGAAKLANAEVVEYFSDVIDEGNGQYKYVYGGITSFEIEKSGAKTGEACLKAEMDCTQWSGAAIGHYPLIDLTKYKKPGIELWVKGAEGGENFEVILIDADDTDGNKTEIGVMASPNFVKTSKEWQKVTIPFTAYPKKGQYWDGNNNKMVTGVDFNAAELKEVKLAVGPAYNKGKKSVVVFVDDVKIVEMP